jgi:filamentous hemagglutinin family protein
MPTIFTKLLFVIFVAVLLISITGSVFASPVLPTGGSFAAGSGTINQSGSSMTINQNTSKGIINWNGFSIGQGGSVFFNNGSGATLNRVTGASISSIAGLLKSTGSLYLINPNGIVITSTGSVITGGDFIASTLNESNSDFLNNIISLSGSQGSVTNQGSITSSGSAILVGTMVTNSGSINSSSDTALASTTNLVFIPDNGLSGILISPSSVKGNVTNSGIIKAASVYLSSTDGDVYALAGNNGGLIEATGTKTINGQVWLTAPKGSVTVSSPVKSSSDIFIDGTQGTNLTSTSNLYSNGGDIKVGLFPSLPESLVTSLSTGASITDPLGSVETSGDTLNMGDITVNAQNWLLDPTDFTIDSSNNGTIDTALGSGNVTITTSASGSPTVTGTTATSGSYNSGTGDINVDAPLSWSSGSALILAAYNNMNVNSTITASGPGELVLDYGNYYETNSAIPGTSLNITGSLDFTQMSTTGNPTGAVFINGITQELVVLGMFSNGVIYPSHGWTLMPHPLPWYEMVLDIYYPTVAPPNNNPTNIQPAPSIPATNPRTSYETYALTHNINVIKCHSTLSPKQSRKLDKEIIKAGGKVAGKVYNAGKVFNKVIGKIILDPKINVLITKPMKNKLLNIHNPT